MSEHDITVKGGSSVRLPTAGKYCDRDILVTALNTGVELPELANPGSAADLIAGKQLIDGSGKPVTGTFTLASEMSAQDTLIKQIKTALAGKASGGSIPGGDPSLPDGYVRCDYIRFSGEQIVDSGIICNQNTKMKFAFVREKSTAHYMFGVVSSDNTASVTAYLGGNWRFGNKAQSKSPTSNEDMIYSGIISNSEITITGSKTAISGVNDFETIGSLLIGSCRNSDGTIPNASFVGKILFFEMWQGDDQVLRLTPVTDGTVFRFWDVISQKFHDSLTDIPLEGGNL